MIILDEGTWSAYSCGERIWRVYLDYALLFLLVVFSLITVSAVRSRLVYGRPFFRGFGALSAEDRRGWMVVFCAIAFALLCLALVPAVSRSMVWLKLDETALVESGCRGLHPYQQRIPLKGMEVSYERIADRIGQSYRLVIRRERYHISIKLNSSSYLANLARFAAPHMKAYVDDLRRDGEAVPAVLQEIWPES
jgi:hypothetical protein